jgi:4a-hydroxytetrahydrobiopterin dehydratase
MSELLTDAQLDTALGQLPGWSLEDRTLVREWQLKDFGEALHLVNAIGARAEAADHHPDILLHSWNKVRVTLSTHSAGGITALDVTLARELSALHP